MKIEETEVTKEIAWECWNCEYCNSIEEHIKVCRKDQERLKLKFKKKI